MHVCVLILMNHTCKKRRGISGLMQVAMIVGIVIIFAGVLFAFAGDIFDIQTVADSVSLQKIFVQNVGDETYLSVNAKNTGNSEITSLVVVVLADTDTATNGVQPFVTSITPSPLKPGMTGSVYEKLEKADGSNIGFSTGQEIAVVLNATTTEGSQLSEPVTVRVR